jgi:hypothetical protein
VLRHVVQHFGSQQCRAFEAMLDFTVLASSYQHSTLCIIRDRVDPSATCCKRARRSQMVNRAPPLHVQIGSRELRLLLAITLSARPRS